MMVFELRRMPPMIVGHPDLIPGFLCPDGGGPPELPEEDQQLPLLNAIKFDDDVYDEFDVGLAWALAKPLTLPWRSHDEVSVGSRRVMDEWMMENDPAWPRDMRPVAFKQSYRATTD